MPAGFTRAAALGPIAAFVRARGGSISRIMADADVPEEILDRPDLPIPLRAQFDVLGRAGREVGDPALGASLGAHVRIERLGAFGLWVSRSPSVGVAMERAGRGLNAHLQTGTDLALSFERGRFVWSITFLDRGGDGRRQNELLGVSYLIDTVRSVIGRSWRPDLVRVTVQDRSQAALLERAFGAPVSLGHAACAVVGPAAALLRGRAAACRDASDFDAGREPPLPPPGDHAAAVSAVCALAMLEGRPSADWIAARLGLGLRSLQRRLRGEGASLSGVIDEQLSLRARALVGEGDAPLGAVALGLGYADLAHFTRAFRRWTGLTPGRYRLIAREAREG